MDNKQFRKSFTELLDASLRIYQYIQEKKQNFGFISIGNISAHQSEIQSGGLVDAKEEAPPPGLRLRRIDSEYPVVKSSILKVFRKITIQLYSVFFR
ncbi:hypothetical protein GWI33_016128 [Rhynchophorus ferrugineus]|uniref:Uncharacterized protein n=1 Tax=Rhynchophorus ferrugineus TaxID=354439 RepID=A0A834HZC3_RHYFE|nr:hypothetical protein GWI33_016128 [Rhynchophorus ferrugineus]